VDFAKELIRTTSPVSVAVTRQMLLRLSGMDFPELAYSIDSRLIAGIFSSTDAVERRSSSGVRLSSLAECSTIFRRFCHGT
jgi:hypothetical protein